MTPSPLPSPRSSTIRLLIISALCLTAHSFQNVGTKKIISSNALTSDSLLSTSPWSNIQSTAILHPATRRTGTNVGAAKVKSGSNTQMSMTTLSSVASSVASPLASISVLALVILVHEAGHFLAARSLGITVKEFSVGVGPRLAGFRRYPSSSASTDGRGEENEDDDGIDFSLRAIPLGGYVRFPENYNGTLAMQQENEARLLRKERRIEQRLERKEKKQLNGDSGLEQTSGLLSMLPFGILEQQAKEEEEFLRRKEKALEEMEKERKSQWWKNMLSLNGKSKEESVVSPADEGSIKTPPIEYYDDPNLLQNRPWAERAIVLSGGVIFNLILAFSLYFGEITVGDGLPRPMFEPGAVVSAMPRSSAPSAGLLEPGDIIVGINGEKLLLSKTSNTPAAQSALTDLISTIRSTPSGESIHLSVIKGGAGASSSEKQPVDITIQPRASLDKIGNPTGPMSIGASLAPNYVGNEFVHASSIEEAFTTSTTAVTSLTSQTAQSLLGFFGSLLSGKGAPAGQGMSGPIGVIKTGADIVSSSDFTAVVMFAAAISINLAVVNSLPLPALDGGQLAFVLAEAVAGRKIDQRLQEEINAAALLMLLIFSFSTAVGDVGSMVGL